MVDIKINDLMCIVLGIPLRKRVRFTAGGDLELRYGPCNGVYRWVIVKGIGIRKCIIAF